MPRNIVIFSDGTGLRGGVQVDENRSNIYKLYRATRGGPDSSVDPAEQIAFYNAGIGTIPPDSGFLGAAYNRFYNFVSQSLGLGLTSNMIACYAALVQFWRPGDRIFLFGFSRGAYTVRCLAAVICKCGIPTQMKDGAPMQYDAASAKAIAGEAVRRVYQHTSSWDKATPRQRQLLAQREALAARFRQRYASAAMGDDNAPNVYPHFIGVFDTVASLSNPIALAILVVVFAIVTLAVSFLAAPVLALYGCPIAWPKLWLGLMLFIGGIAGVLHTLKRIRVAFGLKGHPWWRTLHLTEGRMNFYDTTLNGNIAVARHALAIDETRTWFERVPWAVPVGRQATQPGSFEQFWFAGDHADIGGGHMENFARLPDITLQWMSEAAVTAGLKADMNVLRLAPDPTGAQNDETKKCIAFRLAGRLPRDPAPDAPLHASVIARFEAERVLHYDLMQPYRPENLRGHKVVGKFYKT